MLLWNQAVEILRESIFAYAQACNGNLGAGILAVTFLARLALLPLGIGLARAAADRQRVLTLAQIPLVVALYSSVRQAAAVGGRFFWIRSLAIPDWPLAIVATAFTVLAAATGAVPPAQSRSLMLSITVVVTIIALSKMSAGVGLYWALSSLFGAVQGSAVQRGAKAAA